MCIRDSHTGCICLTYLHCAFSNVSSNGLLGKMHNHTDCICLIVSDVDWQPFHWNSSGRNYHTQDKNPISNTDSVSLHSRDYDILRYSKNMVNVWYFITYKYAKVPLKVEWHSDYSKNLYGKCQFLGQNSALWCNPSSARGSSFPRKFWNYANPQNIERFPFFIGFVGNIGRILSTSDDQRYHHCDDGSTLKGTLKGKEGVSILCRHQGHQGSHQPTKWSQI